MSKDFAVFAGTANPALGAAIVQELGVRLGACAIDRFPDGEVSVRICEPVRRKEVFLVQPTSPPVNDHLVELLALADACRRVAEAQGGSLWYEDRPNGATGSVFAFSVPFARGEDR